ncbi:MAG TPA: hypothetical protein VFK69_00310, partial [Candidatus Eisenbacteria bacterium]|nr:hypothetical protein [Candidatus Eisenbacteria bacterium]
RDPACGRLPVAMSGTTIVYRLPHGFLRAGGDSAVAREGTWRRGVDYLLDDTRGELRLLRMPVPGDTLWLDVCWLADPPPLEVQLQQYRPTAPDQPDSLAAQPPAPERPVTAHSVRDAPSGASLAITGNKTLAVEFGSSQDAVLRQSLDLAVTGTLAPGVQLTGVLSDRSTPLGTTGATQDLQSLDHVLLQLDAPHGSAALGDVPLDFHQGEFGQLARRVQGVRGEYQLGDLHGAVAAADAQGEFRRMQFYGVDGQQGPYLLTDRDGNVGVSVVAGSEVVTLDGQKMSRGESADYSIDDERGELTFTNRRPITAQSRITVDYQFALNRYRRNLAAAGLAWQRGALSFWTQSLTESDDRGRPLDLVLDSADQRLLSTAGDSAARAIAPAVTPGGGDYDTVRVDSTRVIYAWAGPDSGQFHVSFARVTAGRGDYADSAVVAGRTAYRYVGAGQGSWTVGRLLPLPESHQLVSGGSTLRAGALTLETEGAVSRDDRNTFSSLDDGDNVGGAGRVRASLEGALRGSLAGTAGVSLEARQVGTRFAPFSPLAAPFDAQAWGLPLGGDVEHARRVESSAWLAPTRFGRLAATGGLLRAPGGVSSLRRALEWNGVGVIGTRLLWERADARQQDVRFADGGRDHRLAELRMVLPWLEPAVRGEQDATRAPSDSGRVGQRFRELAAEIRSPHALAWSASAGVSVRRDALAETGGFVDQSQARTWRAQLETPAGGWLGASLAWQTRDLTPLASPTHNRSDLASVRVHADDRARGLSGLANLEVTSEGVNRTERTLRFVGPGLGSYDALGNFVGTGDYQLLVTVSPDLDRVARAATHAQLAWEFGRAPAWKGSRASFDFETDTRRRGALALGDPVVSPSVALGDPGLARGAVVQRFEADLAPGSRAAAVRVLLERRVSADRSDVNFAQTEDDRTASLRWRGRASAAWSIETEGHLKRQSASQALLGATGYGQTLLDRGGTGQLVWSPDARLRAAGVVELSWDRPAGQTEPTRTLRLGPDVGLTLGAKGRADVSVRRAFESGPPAVALLPSAIPAGAPRWQGTTRLDYRVRESVTAGVSYDVSTRPGHKALANGRAEVRAFF